MNFDEPMKEVSTPTEMRSELFKQSFHSPLVRDVFRRADIEGMSGEDRFTVLSYFLLQDYKRLQELLLDQTMLSRAPLSIPIK